MRYLTAGLLNINEPQLTIGVLEALARLPHATWAVQVVLVDNGSDPARLQPLQDWMEANTSRFVQATLIACPENVGASEGRNIILRQTTTDRILFLDNDVLLPDHDRWLETLWCTMDAHPAAAIVGPVLVFADQTEIVQAVGIGLTNAGRVGYLHRGLPITAIPPSVTQVVASPSACWLVRKAAQQTVGFFSNDFYPVQFEDVDFCVKLGQVGWKILCDGRVTVRHIGNVTTGNLKGYAFDRLTVRQGIRFREKWADVLPEIATITEEDIYWGPIPRADHRLGTDDADTST